MFRNAKKYITGIPVKQKVEILSDIETLQLSMNSKIFEESSRLFIRKWIGRSDKIDEFVQTFKNSWLDSVVNTWYEGYAPGVPSHNNALEGSNNAIKELDTMRDRLPLSHFLKKVEVMLKEWSEKRDPTFNHIDPKLWQEKPIISLEDWTKARHWLLKKKQTVKLEVDGHQKVFIPTGENTSLSKNEIKDNLAELNACTWQTFEECVLNRSKYWAICINRDSWKESTCTCPYYAKNYRCKHIIGIANLLKIEGSTIPENARDVQLGQKRVKKFLNSLFLLCHFILAN